jgi:hypothetical protein
MPGKGSQMDVDYYISTEQLKPVLSPFWALIFFCILYHYISFLFFPFIVKNLIFNIIHEGNNNIILSFFIQVAYYEIIFLIDLIFLSSFYKTTAITKVNFYEKSVFFNNLSKKMINNRVDFVIYIVIYIIIFYFILSIIYSRLAYVLMSRDPSLVINTNILLWFNDKKFFYEINNCFFPFTWATMFISSFLFMFISLCAHLTSLSFILRPIRFHIWENFK